MTVQEVQDLQRQAQELKEKQIESQTLLDKAQEELREVVKDLKDAFDLDPDQVDDKIRELEAELEALADEYGLMDGSEPKEETSSDNGDPDIDSLLEDI